MAAASSLNQYSDGGKAKDKWGRSEGDRWYGFDSENKNFVVKDQWGRNAGDKWYGFNPENKSWTKGSKAAEANKMLTYDLSPKTTSQYFPPTLQPQQANTLYVENKVKPLRFLTTVEKENELHVKRLKKEGEGVLNYYRNYHASPMYNQMLKKSAGDNFDRYADYRTENLEDVKFDIQKVQPKNKPTSGGFADQTNITILPMGFNVTGVIPHEVSHATDANTMWHNRYNQLRGETFERFIPKKDVAYINAHGTRKSSDKKLSKTLNNEITEFNKYVGEPTETRARLNDIRYQSKQKGIYNPFTQKVTPDIFKKILNTKYEVGMEEPFDALQQLKSVYTDEEIQYMLNNISQNTNSNNELPLQEASLGGNTNDLYNKVMKTFANFK